MKLHTVNKLVSLPSINFLYITLFDIWSGQTFKDQGHYGKVKSHIGVTL